MPGGGSGHDNADRLEVAGCTREVRQRCIHGEQFDRGRAALVFRKLRSSVDRADGAGEAVRPRVEPAEVGHVWASRRVDVSERQTLGVTGEPYAEEPCLLLPWDAGLNYQRHREPADIGNRLVWNAGEGVDVRAGSMPSRAGKPACR